MSSVKSKKRKRAPAVIHQALKPLDTRKPTGIFEKPEKGRPGTLSIALPGSIITNAQTEELKTLLTGQIARAAAVFCVDEVVIFDDCSESKLKQENDPWSDPSGYLNYMLSYAECPPHLRRRFFPVHSNLRTAGLMPPLALPHHAKRDEWCQYREGVTIGPVSASQKNGRGSQPNKKQRMTSLDGSTQTLVDTGFPTAVDADIPPNTRVTVKFSSDEPPSAFPFSINSTEMTVRTEPLVFGEAVDAAAPREDGGYYWGFATRRAARLSKVFTECPFEDGYDVSIGTSERGEDLASVLGPEADNPLPQSSSHALIVFGGLGGLEVAAAADGELVKKGIDGSNLGELFDFYVNVCPGQGSRTIRTEEAILIALGQLRSWVRYSLQ